MSNYTNYELITKAKNEEAVNTLPENSRELMSSGHCSRKSWVTFEQDMTNIAQNTGMGVVVKISNAFNTIPQFAFFGSNGEIEYVIPSPEPGEGLTEVRTQTGNVVYVDDRFKIAFKLMNNRQIEKLLDPVPLKI